MPGCTCWAVQRPAHPVAIGLVAELENGLVVAHGQEDPRVSARRGTGGLAGGFWMTDYDRTCPPVAPDPAHCARAPAIRRAGSGVRAPSRRRPPSASGDLARRRLLSTGRRRPPCCPCGRLRWPARPGRAGRVWYVLHGTPPRVVAARTWRRSVAKEVRRVPHLRIQLHNPSDPHPFRAAKPGPSRRGGAGGRQGVAPLRQRVHQGERRPPTGHGRPGRRTVVEFGGWNPIRRWRP